MNRHSIFFSITISFIISIILVIGSFVILMVFNYKKEEKEIFDRYKPILKTIYRKHHRDRGSLERVLEDWNYTLITKRDKVNAITYNLQTKVIFERSSHRNNKIFRVIQLKDINYIYLKRGDTTILIKDNSPIPVNVNLYIILVFLIVISTIILAYIVTLRKLMPLKLLKQKVESLGNEEFDFECCNTDAKDEVSMLAKEFRNSAKKLKNIKDARNVFIRNIMHELKTPITKGKIIVELPNSEENDEKLKKVFYRLENIINEFASIEELISTNGEINKSYYYLTDVLDNAIDALMFEEEVVKKEIENLKLNINFKLFNVALKNLIDNGVKYSPSKEVTIKTEGETIVLENDGEPLKNELEYYFEPFSHSSSDGFGLGLYIVNNILKANGYKLEYEYIDGTNRFLCKKDN